MRLFITICVAFLAAALTFAQDIPPTASIQVNAEKVSPGEEFKVDVTVSFAPGLHGYQNPPTKDYMIPVSLSGGDGTEIVDVVYPTGTMEMVAGEMAATYGGVVVFTATVLAKETPGKHQAQIVVNYQQCNETMCFRPDSITADFQYQVEELQETSTTPPVKEDPPQKSNDKTDTTTQEIQDEDEEEPDPEEEPSLLDTIRPRIEIKGPKGTLEPGSNYQATLVITFAEGFHAYQNPPSEPSWQIPLEITGGQRRRGEVSRRC